MKRRNEQLDYDPINYDWQDCCNYCAFRNRCTIYGRLKIYNDSNITYDFSILEQGLKCNDYKLDEKLKEKYGKSQLHG